MFICLYLLLCVHLWVCLVICVLCTVGKSKMKRPAWLVPPPTPVFMGLVSTDLPFNLRYWLKIRCVVLPAHSKWTVNERISNLHKVLNQISSCPWNKYCRTSWDIHCERVRVCSKMRMWISYLPRQPLSLQCRTVWLWLILPNTLSILFMLNAYVYFS